MALKHTVLHENATILRQMQASDGRPYKTSVQYNTSIGVEQWGWNLREMRTTWVTTLTTYYDEVRDVLDDEGGSEEVPDVEVGFRVETPEVGLPEVVLPEVPPPGVRDATSWESKKGAGVRKQQHHPQGFLPLDRIFGTNKWEAWVGICLHFIIRESGWADTIIRVFLQMD